MVQSRIKTLAKSQPKEKLQKLKNLEFSFNSLAFAGKQVLTMEHLSFGWKQEKLLINDFSLTVDPEDRIGVIGKNGKGKTTLLKLISGKLNSAAGNIKINPGVELGYFEQTNVQSLNDDFTIEDELLFSLPDSDRQGVRNICGAMMFEKDAALKKISILSGGEKSRVMLGKLLMSPVNLLVLDEPSNHLDIESCDSLMCALDEFKGAVIMVTHNEMFLHSLANRLVVFKNRGMEVFEGTYQEFLDKEGWEDEENNTDKKKKASILSKKEIRQKKSEVINDKSKQINPVKQKIEKLENSIDKNEKLINDINEKLLEASFNQDGSSIQEFSQKLSNLENSNESLFDDLEIHMDKFEKIEKFYDIKLQDLERKHNLNGQKKN